MPIAFLNLTATKATTKAAPPTYSRPMSRILAGPGMNTASSTNAIARLK